MLTIARAGGRFLGPVDWTPYLREVVSRCQEKQFQTLPEASRVSGHLMQGAFCTLRFKVKEELSAQARERVKAQRKRLGKRGRRPQYRETCFRVRATIILDTARQTADAARRERRIRAYEGQLDWVRDHLNKGQYYGRRIEVVSANLLIFIAYGFSLSDNYPRLGYLTFLDAVMAVTFAINAFTVIYNVWLRRLEMNGQGEQAERIDNVLDWLYPISYVTASLVLYILFW